MDENRGNENEGMLIEVKSKSGKEVSMSVLRLAEYMQRIRGYESIKDADLDALSDLITRAKGPFRSMRQFAEDVDVSPATMSRIMNQKSAGPLNYELLAKIAANADEQSGVTLDMLMKANGATRKGTTTRERCREEEVRRTLVDELFIRGYEVSYSGSEAETTRQGVGYKMRFDFMIQTDAIKGRNGKLGKWLFEFKSSMSSVIDEQHPQVGTGRFRQWLTMVMSMYYCGLADADRISYVTDRMDMFNQAKSVLNKVCISDEISIIYVRNGKVRREYVVPTKGEQSKEVFYEIKERDEPERSMEQDMVWDMDAFSDDADE